MGPDLFKRWMDMLFWWLPRDGASSGTAQRPGGNADTAQTAREQPAATDQTTEAPPEAPPETAPETPAESPQETPPEAPPEPSKAAAVDDDAVDDLTAIKGVGPAMAARLHAMGIRTFEELAAADVKAITRQLRDQSVVISEKKVEAWVAAARNQI